MFKKLKSVLDYVVIEYPKEKEIIVHPSYTIKIGTNKNNNVEISIDSGDWQPCRFAEGFWWYDWSNYSDGKHRIVARIFDDTGNMLKKSKIKQCIYRIIS